VFEDKPGLLEGKWYPPDDGVAGKEVWVASVLEEAVGLLTGLEAIEPLDPGTLGTGVVPVIGLNDGPRKVDPLGGVALETPCGR
jgi:hypothetical protein